MVVQCKKGESFVTGEVFPLDIGLLMGANIWIIANGHDTVSMLCSSWSVMTGSERKQYDCT